MPVINTCFSQCGGGTVLPSEMSQKWGFTSQATLSFRCIVFSFTTTEHKDLQNSVFLHVLMFIVVY